MLGWMRYGRNRRDIEPRFFFASNATSTENLLEFTRSGLDAVVLCGLQEELIVDFLKSNHLNMPVVVCTHASSFKTDLNLMPNVGVVLADSESIGRHVGEFFLGHGLENFAFMGVDMNRDRTYGLARCAAFRDAAWTTCDVRRDK